MHEAAIAHSILKIVLQALPAHPVRITKITLMIGALTGVAPECLDLYFTELAKGSPAEGAVIIVTPVAARLVCQQCGHQENYTVDSPLQLTCPKCGGGHQLQGGSDLYIEQIEIEDVQHDSEALT